MKKTVFIVIVWLMTMSAMASDPPVLQQGPCFYIVDTVGCVPLTVKIISCSADNTGIINYDMGDGGTYSVPDPTHIYLTAGVFSVKQEGNFSGSIPEAQSRTKIDYVKVLTRAAPAFDILRCNLQQLKVVITDTLYDRYVIDWGHGGAKDTVVNEATHDYPDLTERSISVRGIHDGYCSGGETVKKDTPLPNIEAPVIRQLYVMNREAESGIIEASFDIKSHADYLFQIREKNAGSFNTLELRKITQADNDVPFQAPGLNTAEKVYEVRLIARDECGAVVAASNVLPSINLEAQALNKKNEISWTSFNEASLDDFTLFSGNIPLFTLPASGYLSQTEETDTRCGQEYCYRMEASFYGGESRSFSAPVCVTGSSSDIPPPPASVLAGVLPAGSVQVSWAAGVADGAAQYEVYRATGSGSFGLFATLAAGSTQVADTMRYASVRCYQVRTLDSCNNISPFSLSTCPVFLRVNNSALGTPVLTWAPYRGYSLGVEEYEIIKTAQDGSETVIATVPGNMTSYTDETPDTVNQIRIYTIRAIPKNPGEAASLSNTDNHIQRMRVQIPTAFTPNGDGLNDTFRAKTLFVKKYELKVFNRWGQVIFATDDPAEGWDGNVNTVPTPPGSYAYDITAEDFNGRKVNEKGLVTLIK